MWALELVGGARMLADGLGCYVHAVVLGSGLGSGLDWVEVINAGADFVHVVDDPALAQFAVEPYWAALMHIFTARRPEIVLFGATGWGAEVAPRVAQYFRAGLLAGCAAVQMDESERVLVGTQPVYGGEYAVRRVCCGEWPVIVTVLPGVFSLGWPALFCAGEIERWAIDLSGYPARARCGGPVEFVPPPVPLRRARRIVAVGRQVGDMALAMQLAEMLGAQVAGAREARDMGWIAEEQVVGALGESVRPDLYVAVGIRGDSLHSFGMRGARWVVAIHPDPDAPIFAEADVGMVGDPVEVMRELVRELGEGITPSTGSGVV
jgi:electron transfer flavoprotein alpha subunit